MRRVLLALLGAMLLLAPAAHAAGPSLVVGAAEDGVKQATVTDTKAKLTLLRLAGFRAVRVTVNWVPGLNAPANGDAQALKILAAAANLTGMRVYVSVYEPGSKTTPLSDEDQTNFATFAATIVRNNPGLQDIIVGNEPNTNLFWLPQFNADGSDAAAPAYEALLAKTYDAIKAVDPKTNVIGGAVSPRGGDKGPPPAGDGKHSPTQFILDLGTAYRASKRTTPIMDAFAIHVYEDNSSLPPSFAHPNSTTIAIADYGKLVGLLGQAFDGTSQAGSTLPIVYGEFGAQTQIPAAKLSLYTGSESPTTKPIDETTQGRYYQQAVALAFCQQNVQALMIFHAFDETSLGPGGGWQSGVYYADGTPKTSVSAMDTAARASRGGTIARCDGLQLTPSAKAVFPAGRLSAGGGWTIKLTCSLDCNFYARLERYPQHSTTLTVRGQALAGELTKVTFPTRLIRGGQYRFTLRLTAPVNPGPPAQLASAPVRLS